MIRNSRRKLAFMSVILAASCAMASSAQALERLDSTRVSCRQNQAAVAAAGALVVGSGPHVYERVVTSAQFCDRQQSLVPHYARSLDQAQCLLGFRCGAYSGVGGR